MKRLLAVCMMVLLASSQLSSQWYVRGGGGYAFSLGGIEVDRDRTESSTGVDTYTYKYGSYGAGFEFTGGIGYAMSANVSAELGVVVNLGPKYEVSEIRQNTAQNRTRIQEASMISFSPAIVVSGQLGGLKPYARMGFVVGFPSLKNTETRPTQQTVDTYSGGQFYGFQGALGTNFELSGKILLFVEASLVGGSWSPTKLEEKDGAVTTTITLKDSFNSTENNVAEQPSFPYGSIGVRAGVRIPL